MEWLRTYVIGTLALAAASAMCLSLGGCATAPKIRGGDPSLPEIDVLQLKENSDEALKLAQEARHEIQTLTAKVIELESRLASLDDQVATLPLSRLKEHTAQIGLLAEQFRSFEDQVSKLALAPRGGRKELAVFQPTAIDTGKPKPAEPAPAPVAHAKPQVPAAKHGAATPAGKEKAARKPASVNAEEGLYKEAMDLYYARDYVAAGRKFEELLQKHPQGTYAGSAGYWIGECHFALGNLAKAMNAFRKVLALPESEKADDAQLKLGYSYLRLGERKRAAEEFKKVVSLFPDSEFTERAKEELAKLE